MAKRIKRAKKGKESLITKIEKHFQKIEEDILEGNLDRGRYHIKEIDKSLLLALEKKLEVINEPKEILKKYKERLEKLKTSIES